MVVRSPQVGLAALLVATEALVAADLNTRVVPVTLTVRSVGAVLVVVVITAVVQVAPFMRLAAADLDTSIRQMLLLGF